jgi:PRC-barrel domain
MLYSISDLKGLKLRETDGEIGSVEDFYFDDATWLVRYLVVDTGTWLSGRKVLLAPQVAHAPDLASGVLPVDLTKTQVANSPDIDLARPIERAMEERLYRHYGWEPYWGEGLFPLDMPRYPGRDDARGAAATADYEALSPSFEPHLRSADTVMHYYIHARDGDIGHVEDFLVDPEAWAIRYMVVATRNWLPGRKVLISPQWIEDISWSENMVHLDLLQSQLRSAPEYKHGVPIERAYESALFEHYRRAPYW